MNYFVTFRTVEELQLDEAQRTIVHNCIGKVVVHWGYELHAVKVLSDHALVLTGGGEIEPEKLLTGMKAWSTRQLRESRAINREQTIWAKYGDIVDVEDGESFEETRLHIEQVQIEQAQDD